MICHQILTITYIELEERVECNVGHALSLMNDKNANIMKDIAELFCENDQEMPNWLDIKLQRGRGGGSSRGRGRGGGPKFGAGPRRQNNYGGQNRNYGSGPPMSARSAMREFSDDSAW